ncbi:MAG: hypothetical protein AMJ56_10355 [Anaerolineae bacterium SG8_19]|jgi:AcrR family transcriptional regulator|nr:MAG: hypothetical protein AMJ56_10355 [Anaerolineae bacterium SG8_19]
MTARSITKLSERQEQILKATLNLVATHGLLKTSISKISKQAQCSPGIVYHYFESKDEIMETLFMRIFSEMMAYVMDESVLKQPLAERYKGLWLRKYHFHLNNPDKTIFVEQYKNSSYYTDEHEQATQALMADLMAMGQADIERGWVIDLPLDIIYTMTFTVALNLAKAHSHAEFRLDDETIDTIAERVVSAVLA